MLNKYTPIYLAFAAMLGLSPVAEAQSKFRKGNSHFDNKEFAYAIHEYQEALQKQTPDRQTAQRIADAYRLTQQTKEAEAWYGKVVAMQGREPMNLFYYAEALRSNGKYKEAEVYYMQWGDEMPENEDRAQELIASCEMALQRLSGLQVADVEPFQRVNNPNSSDFSPMPYGKGIIFTSDRSVEKEGGAQKIYGWTGRPYLQLFTVEQDDQGNWSKPVALQEVINSGYHNATASADAESKTLYFTRTNMVLERGNTNADPTSWVNKVSGNEHINRLEIYIAGKNGSRWGSIKPFAYNKVSEYSVGHPAISPDGNILYFVSDMPGGLGDTDIYYSVKKADGSWGEPVNAGATVNTPGKESFPYVDKDGKLFFASDGHIGLGGLDIFSAEGTHASWTRVKNVGYPLNSPRNDYGIMFTADGSGFLSSNRDSKNGTDDIYQFRLMKKPVVLAISTVERAQNEQKRNIYLPLPQARLAILKQGQKDSTIAISNSKGKYYTQARVGDVFTALGSKPGYLKQEVVATLEDNGSDTVQVVMVFDKNELQKPIVLENIYYDLDKWNIRPDAAKELDKLVTVLKNNPAISIELSSHTDSRESHKYNQVLSDKRAKAAVDYIISQGIDRARLKAKGYGETKLLNGCSDGVKCSEEDHQLNRRTEFKIIKN